MLKGLVIGAGVVVIWFSPVMTHGHIAPSQCTAFSNWNVHLLCSRERERERGLLGDVEYLLNKLGDDIIIETMPDIMRWRYLVFLQMYHISMYRIIIV